MEMCVVLQLVGRRGGWSGVERSGSGNSSYAGTLFGVSLSLSLFWGGGEEPFFTIACPGPQDFLKYGS